MDIPMYFVWLAFTFLNVTLNGAGGTPGAIALLFWIASLIAGLVPYALADRLLVRSRRLPHHRDPDTERALKLTSADG